MTSGNGSDVRDLAMDELDSVSGGSAALAGAIIAIAIAVTVKRYIDSQKPKT